MKRFFLLLSALCPLLLLGQSFTRTAAFRGAAVQKAAAAVHSPTPEILWWKMNEGTGTDLTGEASAGGDDGTTDASWVSGKSGYALSFNGTDQDASSTSSLTIGTNIITISCWLNLQTTSANFQAVLESSHNVNTFNQTFGVAIENSKLQFWTHGLSASTYGEITVTPLATNTWYHILGVINRSVATGMIDIWTNGVAALTTTNVINAGAAANFNNYRLFTASRALTNMWFTGTLDDVRIYNRDASSSVAEIMADPK